MTEPTITCPNCKTEIRLTESLAAPLLAATRKQFEQQLSQKDEETAITQMRSLLGAGSAKRLIGPGGSGKLGRTT